MGTKASDLSHPTRFIVRLQRGRPQKHQKFDTQIISFFVYREDGHKNIRALTHKSFHCSFVRRVATNASRSFDTQLISLFVYRDGGHKSIRALTLKSFHPSVTERMATKASELLHTNHFTVRLKGGWSQKHQSYDAPTHFILRLQRGWPQKHQRFDAQLISLFVYIGDDHRSIRALTHNSFHCSFT